MHNSTPYCVKLKKVLSRRDKDLDREYYRYDVTIPNEVIEQLGWQNTKEIKYKVIGKELRLQKL